MKNVLGGSDAGGAFQNANEARFSGTVLSEDYCHARSEIDLRAGLERIDAVAHFERVEADGFQWISGELLFLNFRNGLETFLPKASFPIAAVSDSGRCRGRTAGPCS